MDVKSEMATDKTWEGTRSALDLSGGGEIGNRQVEIGGIHTETTDDQNGRLIGVHDETTRTQKGANNAEKEGLIEERKGGGREKTKVRSDSDSHGANLPVVHSSTQWHR